MRRRPRPALKSAPPSDGKLAVTFYPEGGVLAAGLENRVFFQARTADGKPADIRGAVLDRSGTEVATVETTHAGMGAFSLVPVGGEQYRLKIGSPAGIKTEPLLPPASRDAKFVLTTNGVFEAGQADRVPGPRGDAELAGGGGRVLRQPANCPTIAGHDDAGQGRSPRSGGHFLARPRRRGHPPGCLRLQRESAEAAGRAARVPPPAAAVGSPHHRPERTLCAGREGRTAGGGRRRVGQSGAGGPGRAHNRRGPCVTRRRPRAPVAYRFPPHRGPRSSRRHCPPRVLPRRGRGGCRGVGLAAGNARRAAADESECGRSAGNVRQPQGHPREVRRRAGRRTARAAAGCSTP